MVESPQVFWSYAHADDSRTQGRVVALAERLRDEYALITGVELEVFLDRNSLAWGDLWREKIEGTVGQTPLFVSVVSPQYMASEECRKEFLAFRARSTSRKLERLLLPIYFVDVGGVAEDSEDELRATVARTQWVDWRELRLKSMDSEEVTVAVNAMANRIAEVLAESRIEEIDTYSQLESTPKVFLDEALDGISAHFSAWMDAVEFDHVAGRQWTAAVIERGQRMERLRAGRAAGGARLGVLLRLGEELMPIASNRLQKAQNYLRHTIMLDPFVSAALQVVRRDKSAAGELDQFIDGVREALLNIEPPDGRHIYMGLPDEWSTLARPLAEVSRIATQTQPLVFDANNIVLRWAKELRELALMEPRSSPEVDEGSQSEDGPDIGLGP